MTIYHNPITIGAGDLTDPLASRLQHLALARGWIVLHSKDPTEPDVSIRLAGSDAAGPKDRGQDDSWWLEGSWVELCEKGSESRPSGEDELVHRLPVDSNDDLWITVIENAAHVGRAVRRRREKIQHLHHASTTDAMTGVYNRTHLLSVLSKEYKRFQRSGEPLSCFLIDIDHFKNINDTYGHKFGDEILIAFSQLLRDSIRESDIIGRYGGEEFLCILPNTNLDGACALAEKLRSTIEARIFSEGFFNIDLSGSFGVASTTSADITNSEQLLQWADRALYRAKQSGRNRVCLADEKIGVSATHAGVHHLLHSEGDKPVLLLAHQHYEDLLFYHSLARRGSFELVTMTDGDAVLNYLSKNPPTIALIQATLPPLGGGELVRRIRGRMTDHYFPIAILQPADLTAHQDTSYHAGADDILSEMISVSEFERRMQVFLRLKLLHERFTETYDRLTAARARLVKAERLSALGQMASGVAHDFNNVLSAILGRTEQLLRAHGEDESLSKELSVIQKAASDGAKTIKRIQEFSRSISHLDSMAVPLADIVDDCLQLTRVKWKDEAGKLGIKYEIENKVDPSLATSANPTELREVFMNLIINALDAMNEGGKLEIRSRRPKGSDRFLIEVRDDGPGMEAEVAKRIFEPFFTTKNERGTGLGLSITYGIVTRMGGKIEVRSAPGRGTVFQLWFLPPEKQEENLELERVSVPVEVTLQAHGPKLAVLVVDDEESVRDLFVDVLREEGHTVFEADCARKAMELATLHHLEAVITDLGMPDLPGWDVARFVKDRSPGTFVVLTSGWGDDFSEEYLAARGVDRWLPKPVSLDELFSLLRSVQPIADDKDRESA